MRVVEKSVINDLILRGEENLKEAKTDVNGKWIRVYAPEVFDKMIIELEVLRKELDGLVFEIGGDT